MLTHFGMGSGTAIRLASLESYALQSKLNLSRSDLVNLSERGGVSGVGVNTYFDGGYVFDLGVPDDGSEFRPSSATRPKNRPLVLSQTTFPKWGLGLCIPTSIDPKTQDEERDFFSKNTPIKENETKSTAYHCLFGVHASVLEGRYNKFCKSIISLQSTIWKNLERKQYGQHLKKLESKLYDSGADCVGMSSLGPLLYFFASNSHIQNIIERMNGYECEIVLTSSTNKGRVVTTS